jgi:hypothetical protein
MKNIALMQIFLKGYIDKDDFINLVEKNPFFVKRICDYYYMDLSDLRVYILSGDFNVVHLYEAIIGIIEDKKNYYPFEFIKLYQDFNEAARNVSKKCESMLNGINNKE